MNTDRIKEIQKETAYPDSVSVQQALLKVWSECENPPHLAKKRKNREAKFMADLADSLEENY